MAHDAYTRLRDVLDTIPNGFPETGNGLEIRILQKIFNEEEADIASRLKIKFETAQQIAERLGMDPAYLSARLEEMQGKGQIFRVKLGEILLYKLLPFVFGIYEWQVYRMDRELAEMTEEYMLTVFGHEFASRTPSLLKVVPIEKEIENASVIEPYQKLSEIINNAKAWAVEDCICKKEKHLLDHGCDKPREVCIGIAPIENFFDEFFWGKAITKEEAMKVLDMAEEAGLVHMTSNVQDGHLMICNCCGCCCGLLQGINRLGLANAAAKSNFVAMVEESLCTSCGICLDRCQVKVIDLKDYAMINDRCIGCGLCVSTCPTGAMSMVRRNDADLLDVPLDEKDWIKKRGLSRGSDSYKKLL